MHNVNYRKFLGQLHCDVPVSSANNMAEFKASLHRPSKISEQDYTPGTFF